MVFSGRIFVETKMKLIKIYLIEVDMFRDIVIIYGFDGDGDHIEFTIRFDNLSKSAITRGEDSIIRAAKVRLKRRYKGLKFKFND